MSTSDAAPLSDEDYAIILTLLNREWEWDVNDPEKPSIITPEIRAHLDNIEELTKKVAVLREKARDARSVADSPEAVEVLARRLHEESDSGGEAPRGDGWDGLGEQEQETFRGKARLHLEAVTPLIISPERERMIDQVEHLVMGLELEASDRREIAVWLRQELTAETTD